MKIPAHVSIKKIDNEDGTFHVSIIPLREYDGPGLSSLLAAAYVSHHKTIGMSREHATGFIDEICDMEYRTESGE